MYRYLNRDSKRQRTCEAEEDAPVHLPPNAIVSWNCNSLKLRCDRKEIGGAIKRFLDAGAQAVTLQEVRLRGEDKAQCEQALRAAGLNRHKFFWSLHPNKRYSGVLLVVDSNRAPLSVRYDLKGLADPSLKYPFNSSSRNSHNSRNGDEGEERDDPELEGRIIIAEYPQCWLVCVYVPMASWHREGRARRAVWDARLASALQTLQRGVEPPPPPSQPATLDGAAADVCTGGGATPPPDDTPVVAGNASAAPTAGLISAPPIIPPATKVLKASKITSFFSAKPPPPSPAPTPAKQSGDTDTAQPPQAGSQPPASQPSQPSQLSQPAPAPQPAQQSAAPMPPTRTMSGVGRSGITGRPVILVGDLNVSHTPLDVSHPDFFATAAKPGETRGADTGVDPGQPGFTAQERERFGALLLCGGCGGGCGSQGGGGGGGGGAGLVDSFRALHPGDRRLTWGWGPNFESGRYAGKYMGLDYTLVSQKLWEAGAVTLSEVVGASAAECHGSDHAPILAKFDWSKVEAV